MTQAVKLIKETADSYTIGGYGVVWGGKDLVGEHFEPTTDFWLGTLSPTPPVLYEHGFDEGAKKSVLGMVTATKSDDFGLWVESQLEKSRDYVSAVMELVKKGVLGYSSGSIAHLVEKTKGGQILTWPIAEMSLTPDPCEPRTIGVADLSDVADDPAVKSLIDTIKALPTGNTPMTGEHGSMHPEGSYEALIDMLGMLAQKTMAEPGEYAYGYVMATFPGYLVYCDCSEDENEYFRIAYTVDAVGMPTLGEFEHVEPMFVPMQEAPEMSDMQVAPVATASINLARIASVLDERTKGLVERRAAEHRSLSESNVKALASAVDAADASLASLRALLAADTTATAKAEDVSVQMLQHRIAILATEIEMAGMLAS